MGAHPPRALLAVLAAAILVLAGCANTARVPAGGTLRVALTEYHVQPQSVHAAAGVLTIYVHNYGRLSHDLVISQGGIPQAATKPIAPGQGAELLATLTPGQYLMASTVLSDQALGAYGTLTVGR